VQGGTRWNRTIVGFLAFVASAIALMELSDSRYSAPLWLGTRYTRAGRDRAIERGLNFMYRSIAKNPAHFQEWGSDLLFAFYKISETSQSPQVRRLAFTMGHERAQQWRRIHPAVPKDADAYDVTDLASGNDAAERLGVPGPQFRAQLRAAAPRLSVYDYYLFDPAKEPPPSDVPEECSKCGLQNERGQTICKRCGTKLTMRNRYALYQDALIGTYTGDHTGITLGVPYALVLQWLPVMRPYPPRLAGNDSDYYGGVYSATHLIYTYNDYSRFKLSRQCFAEEFAHLTANLRQAITEHDPETMGEYLDSLRSFGLTLQDPLVRNGFEYLLSAQNADGSWGDIKDPDPYGRYHPTWTAIDGLRDYRWTQVLPCPVFGR
jgi:hypothetical protein